MRTLPMAGVVGAALLTAGIALPGPASAMPLAPVAAAPSLVENVAEICPRCRPYGPCSTAHPCGWDQPVRDGIYVFVRPNHSWYRFYHQPSYHPWTYRTDYPYDPYGWTW